MNVRRGIVSKSTKSSPVAVIRRRRGGGVASTAPGRTGEVKALRNGEDFTLSLLRASAPTINAFRGGKYLHVSDILGKCMRKIALAEKYKQPIPPAQLMDALGLTFAQGTAIHDYVKAKVADAHPEMIYGRWSCLCGQTKTLPMVRTEVQTTPCDHCNTPLSQYHEMELFDEELTIVGSPDITLYLGDEEVFYPVEIKSINAEAWKEILRPMPDHVLQVLFYWHLFKKLGYSLSDQISILYVNKGFQFKSPYKEFLVYAPEEVHRLEPYLQEVQELVDFRKGGPIPARAMCPTAACKDAKECHLSTVCFQHD